MRRRLLSEVAGERDCGSAIRSGIGPLYHVWCTGAAYLPNEIVERHYRPGDIQRRIQRIREEIREVVLLEWEGGLDSFFIGRWRRSLPIPNKSCVSRDGAGLSMSTKMILTDLVLELTSPFPLVTVFPSFTATAAVAADQSIPNEINLNIVILKLICHLGSNPEYSSYFTSTIYRLNQIFVSLELDQQTTRHSPTISTLPKPPRTYTPPTNHSQTTPQHSTPILPTSPTSSSSSPEHQPQPIDRSHNSPTR